MTSRRLFKFSAPGNESTPEPSPEQKPNPEVVTSGESDFESAKGSPALEPTGRLRESPASEPTRRLIDVIEGPPQVDIERAASVEEPTLYLLENPEDEHDLDPLVESSYFTEPRPDQPLYSPFKNLLSTIRTFNQPLPIQTITMAQPTNGPKELNLNKPETFDGNRNNFKDF
jgi:hypothetical protein